MKKLDFSLFGRVALVTGASRGIGYHLALELAERGAHIIALARTMSGLTELDNQIQKKVLAQHSFQSTYIIWKTLMLLLLQLLRIGKNLIL